MYLCIDSKTQKYVCILSIVRSRVSLHFKYEAEGFCSQPTGKFNKMCVYFKYRAFVCFPFNFSWSVVSSAYCTLKIIINIRLLNYPDGGMLNADSNADFVKLYQTSLPTRLHLTSMNVYTQKYSIPGKLYSVLRSSSLSIGTLYANRERKHSFRRSFINP
jgi:hypothetical protein